jgi:hypothetical protein
MYIFIYANKFPERAATSSFLVITLNVSDGEGKVSLVLFVIDNHAVKAYWGVEV